MRRSIFLIFPFFLTLMSNVSAQKESFTWYFGKYAGIDFNVNQSPRALTNNNVMNQLEGCATISDPNGEMLFFTDGKTVWNKIFKPMPNGNDLLGARSSTQSAIIVPDPGNLYQYYIFTIDSENSGNGLRYSIVDMLLDYGLGDVRNDKKNQLLYENVTEKLSAVIDDEFLNYWIITHEATTKNFISFKLTPELLITTPVVSQGITIHTDKVGYLKFAPNGSRIACAVKNLNLIEIYHFDRITGKIANNNKIVIENLPGAYGIEFSPDATQLYVSWEESLQGRITQFNLMAGDGSQIPVENSKKIIAFDYQYLFGAMQLAPDGNIYITKFLNDYNGHTFLDAIYNPNSYSENIFVRNALSLNNRESMAGLPNFVQSFFLPKRFIYDESCLYLPTQFHIPDKSNIDSVMWNFGDPISGQDYSTDLTPVHVFSGTGTFNVTLSVFHLGSQKDYMQTIRIYPRPEITLGNDTSICHPIVLDAGEGSVNYLWSTGETSRSIEVTKNIKDQVFWVRVENFMCWNSDTIVIKGCQPCDVFLPNAFSPNNDGKNDNIKVLGGNYSSIELAIYNYSGTEVFRTNNPSEYWDGTFKGQKLEMGVYVYILKAICIEGTIVQKSGNITLLR